MKIALIECIETKKRIEIRDINEKEFLKMFKINSKDIYNGLYATSKKNNKEYYITIVNYK